MPVSRAKRRGKDGKEEYASKSLEELLLAEDVDAETAKAVAEKIGDTRICPPGEEYDEGRGMCVPMRRSKSTRKRGQLIDSLLDSIKNRGTQKRGPTEKQIQEAIQANWPDFLKEMKAIMKSSDGGRKAQVIETVKDFQGAIERDLIAAAKN